MKKHYPWWSYIKEVIRHYPSQRNADLHGVDKLNHDAVQAAVEATERMEDGEDRMKLIKLVYWDGTHTIDGAAQKIPCGRRTAMRMQRNFFETVARNRGLLD